MSDALGASGSQQPRLSQGPSAVRKGARPLPTYRNEANFGRASGKIINIGSVAKDADGFEPFDAYLDYSKFRSPSPKLSAKTTTKPKNKPPPKKSIVATPDLDDDLRNDADDAQDYFARSSPAPAPPPTSRRVGNHSRAAPQSISTIDYDSIPEPAPRRKTSAIAPSSRAPAASSNRHASQSHHTTTTNKSTKGPGKGKERELSAILEDDDQNDNVDDDEIMEAAKENSNMSLATIVDTNQASTVSALNQDDDDSGPEDFSGRDDNVMDVDDEEPEQPVRNGRNRSVRQASEEVMANDEQFDDEDRDQEMPPPDEEEQQDEEREPSESPKSKRSRLAREKKEIQKAKEEERAKAKAKRPPLKTKDQNAPAKKAKRNWNPEPDDQDDLGLRRGKRQRYAPLEFWRGEHAVVRRPRHGDPPVPIIKEIIRIKEDPAVPLGTKYKRRGTTKPPSSRGGGPRETFVENPEDGLDDDTESLGIVIDYETKEDVEQVIAKTAAQINPKRPTNAEYGFEKVFNDSEFIAAGVLEIPIDGRKPNKPARDNTYMFYCMEGAVRVMVHRSTFVISRGGMFMVPRGNQYYIENISDRPCKLFFSQARKVTDRMIPSPSKRASAGPNGRLPSHTRTESFASSSPFKTPMKKKEA